MIVAFEKLPIGVAEFVEMIGRAKSCGTCTEDEDVHEEAPILVQRAYSLAADVAH